MELRHIERGRRKLAGVLGLLGEESTRRDRTLDPSEYLWLSVIDTRWKVAPARLVDVREYLIPTPRRSAETHVYRFPKDQFPSLHELAPFLSRLGLVNEKQLMAGLQVGEGSLLYIDQLASESECLIQELLESPYCSHSGWNRLTIEGFQVGSSDGHFTEETPYAPENYQQLVTRAVTESFLATYSTICRSIQGTIWQYYTPSAGETVTIHAILVANGNEFRLLCEDEADFLVLSFVGS